jgi:hypothetical protein
MIAAAAFFNGPLTSWTSLCSFFDQFLARFLFRLLGLAIGPVSMLAPMLFPISTTSHLQKTWEQKRLQPHAEETKTERTCNRIAHKSLLYAKGLDGQRNGYPYKPRT